MRGNINWDLLITGELTDAAPVGDGINTRLYPSVVEATALPGAIGSSEMLATNAGVDAIMLEAFVCDMILNEAGVPLTGTRPLERGCAAWLSIQPDRFALQPGETQTLRVLARPPRIAQGGYYALIAFTQPSIGFNDATRPVCAADYLLTVAGGTLAADVRPVGLEVRAGRAQANANWSITARLTNVGNVHRMIVGELTLKAADGRLLETCPLTAGRGFVLPGMERDFIAEGHGPLADGEYVAEISLHEVGSLTGSKEQVVFTITRGLAQYRQTHPQHPSAATDDGEVRSWETLSGWVGQDR